jgi:hypothetical protein
MEEFTGMVMVMEAEDMTDMDTATPTIIINTTTVDIVPDACRLADRNGSLIQGVCRQLVPCETLIAIAA